MLRFTAGRVGSLLARRATAALSTGSARMASQGPGGPGAADTSPVDMSQPMYTDRVDIPLPDKPYKDVLTDVERRLKEKEKGPWGQLSKEEKIALYRIAFCQTYPEMNQKSEEWKTVLGGIFIFLGLSGLLVWWNKTYVSPPRPRTFDDDWQAQQLQRMLDMRVGHIQGLSSKWDYEKGQWK